MGGGWYPIRKGRKDSQDEVSRSNRQNKTCWISQFLKMWKWHLGTMLKKHRENSFLVFSCFSKIHFYRTRVRSLFTLVSNSLTNSCLVNLIDWPWHVKIPTKNLLRLLLLIMLAKVCWFGSWRLVMKLNFCSVFEHKGWSRFRSWSLGEILKLEFVQHFAADAL